MNKRTFLLATATTLAAGTAAAQYGNPKMQDLAGAWMVTSVVLTKADGSKDEVFGKDMLGTVLLTGDGHYSVVLMRADLPKIKVPRPEASAEDSMKIVHGSLAYTGSFKVDGDSLSMLVKTSTYPAWVGQTQKRKFTLKGDQLQWVGVTPVQGASVLLTAKRAK
jgi:hypothetical protein